MNNAELRRAARKIKELGEEVRKHLGCGFNESVYQNALAIEFRRHKIEYLMEVNIEVFYKNESVGEDRPDFVLTKVGGHKSPIILELKASDAISDNHRMQLLSYCKSLPRNNNPVLKGFEGGIVLAFPTGDLDDATDVKIFVVDRNFKLLIDEQFEEDEQIRMEKEAKKLQSMKIKK